MSSQTITVIGAGSWGTALASLLASNGHVVYLWGRNQEHIASMRRTRCNTRYLPGLMLPDNIIFETCLETALSKASGVLIATPSDVFRSTLQSIKPHLLSSTVLLWSCKGIERDSAKLLHQLIDEELAPHQASAIISGPTFAKEIVQGLPAAVTVASLNTSVAETAAGWFHSDNFRAYTSVDVVGVEVGGALKNVYAIAAGIADGLGFGANSRSALITRGLAELMRLGVAMGGCRETFMGLAGMGDLVLTCTDDQSRNRRMGLAIARGLTVAEAKEEIGQAVEGIKSTQEAWRLAARHQVSMPIVEQVYKVIYDDKCPRDAVKDLLNRHPKFEMH